MSTWVPGVFKALSYRITRTARRIDFGVQDDGWGVIYELFPCALFYQYDAATVRSIIYCSAGRYFF
jgi:hypothetical protein